MSKLSEYLKERKQHDLVWFLGQEPHKESNKYVTFNHVIDEDNIIIATNNIKAYYDKNDELKVILMVGENKAVYLKDWQVRKGCAKVGSYSNSECYIVKLNRNYFKPYTFKNVFEGMSFEEKQTFDMLKAGALTQNETYYHLS